MKNHSRAVLLFSLLSLCGCEVGPKYQQPKVAISENYKEGGIIWKKSTPNAEIDRGKWWEIFNDSDLNNLIDSLNKNNLSIKTAHSTYMQSLAIVNKTRSGYFPSLSLSHSSTSQKANYKSKTTDKDSSSHSLSLDASWEADLWGANKYSVESDDAAAKASKAELALATLSVQSSLAQYYFELRGLDKIQEILDEIIVANKKILTLTKSNYKAGTIDQASLLSAENSLHNAESDSYNNKINRSQYQHAIAVLIGESPSNFNIQVKKGYQSKNIFVPFSIPSELLERRPDIAKSEELVKQANAKIGIAQTAFFPSIGLGANLTMKGDGMGNLLSMPNFIWSLGSQMALGLFDAGARNAQKKSTIAAYEATVSSYKLTVLNAFAEVEDQLSSLENLSSQEKALNKTANNSKKLYDIAYSQYISGIVNYSQLLNSQISYLNVRKSSTNIEIQKRSTEIALIKALGGSWT